MRALLVARREFLSTFESPVGYVVLAVFPALAAALFFVLGSFFAMGEASLREFFSWMPWLLVLLAPAITMRLWAEERRSGTEEWLLTMPFRLQDLVLGKFLGAWAVLAAALTFTLGVPLTVASLGDLDWGPVWSGYCSTLLLGGASLSVGLFLSSCTSNQIVAWLLGACSLLAANLIGAAAVATAMPPGLGRLFLALDFGEHFHSITRGVLDLESAAFYLGVMVVCLSANHLMLERRRWWMACRSTPARREAHRSFVWRVLTVVPLVALAGHLHWRIDFTEEKAYSLAPATIERLQGLEDRLQVKLYFNRDIEGAESLLPARLVIEDLLGEIERYGAPWVSVETVDPTTDLAAKRDAEHIGVEPLPISAQEVGSISVDLLYQGLELRYQNRSQVIPFVTPNELEFAFTVRLAELQSERRPVIGMVSDEPLLPPQMPGIPRQIPAGRIYEELRVALGQRYAVRDLDLSQEGAIGDDIVALIVACPWNLDPAQLKVLDRYLAEGGHVMVLQDPAYVDVSQLTTEHRATGLEEWLAHFGISVDSGMVYDLHSVQVESGSREITTPTGPQRVPVYLPYGFGLLTDEGGLSEDHVVTAKLEQLALYWAHPVHTAELASGLSAEAIVHSSEQSWVMSADTPLDMRVNNLQALNRQAQARGAGARHPLAVAVRGRFPALHEHESLTPAEGLLVVIGNSELFHNATLQTMGGASSPNGEFAANLADWLAQDEGLIGLRSRGKSARPLADFGRDYVEAQGGWSEEEEANRELDRDASLHRRAKVRRISWSNVLIPPVVVLLLAWGHRLFHGRRARRAFRRQEGRA